MIKGRLPFSPKELSHSSLPGNAERLLTVPSLGLALSLAYSFTERGFTFFERQVAYTSLAQFLANLLYMPVLVDLRLAFGARIGVDLSWSTLGNGFSHVVERSHLSGFANPSWTGPLD